MASLDSWIQLPPCTYASATTFTLALDLSSVLAVGDCFTTCLFNPPWTSRWRHIPCRRAAILAEIRGRPPVSAGITAAERTCGAGSNAWRTGAGHIAADGLYGDQTATVARQFQAEKGLHVDALIGPDIWAAAAK